MMAKATTTTMIAIIMTNLIVTVAGETAPTPPPASQVGQTVMISGNFVVTVSGEMIRAAVEGAANTFLVGALSDCMPKTVNVNLVDNAEHRRAATNDIHVFFWLTTSPTFLACAETKLAEFAREPTIITGAFKELPGIAVHVHNVETVTTDPNRRGLDGCSCLDASLIGVITNTNEMKHRQLSLGVAPSNFGAECQPWDVMYSHNDKFAGAMLKNWCLVDMCNCDQRDVRPWDKFSTSKTTFGLGISYSTCDSAIDRGPTSYWILEHCGVLGFQQCQTSTMCHIVNSGDDGSAKCNPKNTGVWLSTLSGQFACGGAASCPCINPPDLNCVGICRSKVVLERPSGGSLEVASHYGVSCSLWDVARGSEYDERCLSGDAPHWCYLPWCYVDMCNCDVADQLPSTRIVVNATEIKLAFSYDTCGGHDADPENYKLDFCNKRHEEQSCDKWVACAIVPNGCVPRSVKTIRNELSCKCVGPPWTRRLEEIDINMMCTGNIPLDRYQNSVMIQGYGRTTCEDGIPRFLKNFIRQHNKLFEANKEECDEGRMDTWIVDGRPQELILAGQLRNFKDDCCAPGSDHICKEFQSEKLESYCAEDFAGDGSSTYSEVINPLMRNDYLKPCFPITNILTGAVFGLKYRDFTWETCQIKSVAFGASLYQWMNAFAMECCGEGAAKHVDGGMSAHICTPIRLAMRPTPSPAPPGCETLTTSQCRYSIDKECRVGRVGTSVASRAFVGVAAFAITIAISSVPN